jgi:solute carrier family 25 phosphate transporter 23/24/25/41
LCVFFSFLLYDTPVYPLRIVFPCSLLCCNFVDGSVSESWWSESFGETPSSHANLQISSDFLLFMPSNHDGSPLEAALSFYSSIVTVNPEGDSLVSDDTLEGLGTVGFLLQALFGSLLRIANPDLVLSPRRPADAGSIFTSQPPEFPYTEQITSVPTEMAASAATVRYGPAVAITPQVLTDAAVKRPILQYEGAQESGAQDIADVIEEDTAEVTSRLTDLLPEPGYFLAGAISGGVSRTATAPLDRLKVYLLVNTTTKANVAVAAAKQGRPLAALRNASGPIVDAVVSLWKAGGMKTFFAGKQIRKLHCRLYGANSL